jgi:MFS superfamily sulfate permease-like transporter
MRWPVSSELARLDAEEGVDTRMSDEAAGTLVVLAGVSSLALIAVIPVAVLASLWAALSVDIRYASLLVLVIMPWTFVELWRRA